MKFSILLMLSVVLLLGLVFAANVVAAEHDHERDHDHGTPFSWFSLVKPLGIATLSSLCLTFLAGLFRKKLGRRFRKIHFVLAIITVTLAVSHGMLVLVLFGW